LPSGPLKPVIAISRGDNYSISNEILLDLMREVLARGADFRFRVKGFSMLPFIHDGDVITLAPMIKEKPAVGKVVAFIRPGSGNLVVHRVVGKLGSKFIIQGDNTAGQPDGLVLPPEILGCVVRVERSGRRVYLGLGWEGYLMAVLSRNGLLFTIVSRMGAMKSWFMRSRRK
jgi:hypothetical protein